MLGFVLVLLGWFTAKRSSFLFLLESARGWLAAQICNQFQLSSFGQSPEHCMLFPSQIGLSVIKRWTGLL